MRFIGIYAGRGQVTCQHFHQSRRQGQWPQLVSTTHGYTSPADESFVLDVEQASGKSLLRTNCTAMEVA